MANPMVAEYRQALESADLDALQATIAPDVTMRVAVHDGPIEGRDGVLKTFGVLFSGVFTHMHFTDALVDGRGAALSFRVQMAGYPREAEGVNLVRFDDEGRVRDSAVFLRPLAALNVLAREMGRRMGPAPEGRSAPPPDRGDA